ncbi:hypothetical protein [Sporosarcina aquimarina]|uniref:Uncharacterized protein n=1 Tax=Sporosarcina aquimarina TaxID=114975 RepID=A0ABU4FYF5_9BACL|nr:hypothetical protein [Sporosarcina aquimarina]MDW0109760.1 hypothetical protein [Sporosarcina aquimarina]
MKKIYGVYILLGILSWTLMFSGIFKWAGIPTFDKILTAVLGEATAITNTLAIVITGAIAALIIFACLKLTRKVGNASV